MCVWHKIAHGLSYVQLTFKVCAALHCLQLEPVMSYNATFLFEYMNTYADIMYAYGVSAAIRHNGNCIPYIGMLIVFQLLIV